MIPDTADTGLSRATVLPFPLRLVDGGTLSTVGEAIDYIAKLSEERRTHSHWRVTIKMFEITLREPTYLRAATMSLQTALAMDGLLGDMQTIGFRGLAILGL